METGNLNHKKFLFSHILMKIMNPWNDYHIKSDQKTKKSNLCHLVQMSLSLSNQF